MRAFWQKRSKSKAQEQVAAVDWLVVGLGNPGPQYAASWHNLGFMSLDLLAEQQGLSLKRLRFKGLTAAAQIAGQKVLFLQPHTYMNLSGESVREALRFYKLPVERVLVLVDDFEIPLGKIRIRAQGSAGSHNGLRSLIYCLESTNFPRVRIGFGPLPEHYEVADFVLQKIPQEQRALAQEGVVKAVQAVELIIGSGLELAMSRLNGR